MCIGQFACFRLLFLCAINRHCLQAYITFLVQWKCNCFICHESTKQHPKDQIWIKLNDPPYQTLLNISNISCTSCMTSVAGERKHVRARARSRTHARTHARAHTHTYTQTHRTDFVEVSSFIYIQTQNNIYSAEIIINTLWLYLLYGHTCCWYSHHPGPV